MTTPPTRAHAGGQAGEAAKAIEHTRPELPARQRPIERRHGPGMARIIVIDPGPQHRREHHRQPLRAQHAARAGGIDVGRGQHPLL